MSEPKLNYCGEPNLIKGLNIDPPPPFCREAEFEKTSGTIDKKPFFESQSDVAGVDLSWLQDPSLKKSGDGESALCDPQQTGHILNEQGMSPPNRDVVYRYHHSLRGTDEAIKNLFNDIVVVDDNGKAHSVPIVRATPEKAVAYILQENVRKNQNQEGLEDLVVDRIRLPIMAIHTTSYSFSQNRYVYHKAIDYLKTPINNWKPRFTTNEKYERDTVFGVSKGLPYDIGYELMIWATYQEDMNQIMTQIMTKFSPMAYIRVKGIAWEIGVKLDSIGVDSETEPGDKKMRGAFKYQFLMTAESFVAQPIVRKKAVLKTRIEMTDSPDEEDITQVMTRLEEAVKEFEE